ncbi:hypothetical protein [Marivirga harenae]|uniref:hypothetical protein n=1 Tax=Marivirga harenae TaxID=2010992 RepID=UPI0026DEC6D1|nr:hypothetical protein [Marivirga harenae]WKV12770.1 hypothetical protein Q3Y49_02880 [Marivirga harenae]
MRNLVVLIALVFASCSSQKENKQEESLQSSAVAEQVNPVIKSIQEAHNLDAFMEERIISFDINLIFGGNERLDARIYSTTTSSKVLVENSENTRLLFDGNEIWIHPKDSLYDGARFDALTWSYFFMALLS